MLLDLKLPDIAGQELPRRLAEHGHRVPFIVITGYADVQVAVDMMRQGAVDYLVKDRQFLQLVPAVVCRVMAQLDQEKRLAAAEEALRVSEERFRVALKNSPIVVFNQDRALRYTWMHSGPGGPDGRAVLGKTSADLFHPDEAARLTEIQQRVLTTGGGTRAEVQCTFGGRARAYDLTVEPVRDAGGDIIGVTCAAMDITGRKRAERRQHVQYATTLALAESNTLAEAAPRVLQAVGETLGWSYAEFWGVDPSANVLRFVQGWHSPGIACPEFEAFSREITFAPGVGLMGRVWAQREPVWIADLVRNAQFTRTRIASAAGFRSTCALPVLLSGEALGVMDFFSGEVQEPDSELMQLFEAIGSQFGQFIERKRAEEALKSEHAFISAVLDTSGALVVVLDRSGRIVRFNRACEQASGYSFEEVKGRPLWDLFIIPEELEAVTTTFKQLAAGHVPSQHENQWRSRTGQLRSITWSNTILAGKDGTVQYIIGTGIDTTERKRLEGEILQISDLEQSRLGQDLHD
jgi:PAS domain S-box-containing protein